MKKFSQRAVDIVSDAKIQAAIEEGDFDNLPGMGKPFEFDDTQYDPHWWIRRKMEREKIQQLVNQQRKQKNENEK